MSEQKRFEDWEEVSCNECGRYWQDSCDGVKEGSRKPCNSFIATRKVVIPARLKALENSNKWLRRWCLLLSILWLLGVVFIYG
jgi:hypothetical protein